LALTAYSLSLKNSKIVMSLKEANKTNECI
jgi:hypothetical protein